MFFYGVIIPVSAGIFKGHKLNLQFGYTPE